RRGEGGARFRNPSDQHDKLRSRFGTERAEPTPRSLPIRTLTTPEPDVRRGAAQTIKDLKVHPSVNRTVLLTPEQRAAVAPYPYTVGKIAGVNVPRVGQGTFLLDQVPLKDAVKALRSGIEAGATHIDTAEAYGSGKVEEIVREAIQGQRDKVYLVSKVGRLFA